MRYRRHFPRLSWLDRTRACATQALIRQSTGCCFRRSARPPARLGAPRGQRPPLRQLRHTGPGRARRPSWSTGGSRNPAVGGARHPVRAAQLRHHRTRLGLLQDADDPLFRKPLPLHSSVPSKGRSPGPGGWRNGGQVTFRSRRVIGRSCRNRSFARSHRLVGIALCFRSLVAPANYAR